MPGSVLFRRAAGDAPRSIRLCHPEQGAPVCLIHKQAQFLQDWIKVPVDVFVDSIIDPVIKCRVFKVRDEFIIFSNHPFDGFRIGIKGTDSHARIDDTADGGGSFDLISTGRNTEYIGENLHEQLTVGPAARNDKVSDRLIQGLTHFIHVVFYGKRDAFQNGSIDVGPGMASVKSKYHAFAVHRIHRGGPVMNRQQAFASGRDFFRLPFEQFFNGDALFPGVIDDFSPN